jgi:hypothetical protein
MKQALYVLHWVEKKGLKDGLGEVGGGGAGDDPLQLAEAWRMLNQIYIFMYWPEKSIPLPHPPIEPKQYVWNESFYTGH